MGIRLGTHAISAIYYIGGDGVEHQIQQVRDGSKLVYTNNPVFDDFDGPNQVGLSGAWVDEGSATTPHLASQYNGTCRMNIPEADGGSADAVYASSWRFAASVPTSNDGYIECLPAEWGSGSSGVPLDMPGPVDIGSGGASMVLRRVTNSGFDRGSGLIFNQGLVAVVALIGDDPFTDIVSLTGGASYYSPGQAIRDTQIGNAHYLSVGGQLRQAYNFEGADPNQTIDASHRSMGIMVMGGVGAPVAAAGQRWASAAFDYVEAGLDITIPSTGGGGPPN